MNDIATVVAKKAKSIVEGIEDAVRKFGAE